MEDVVPPLFRTEAQGRILAAIFLADRPLSVSEISQRTEIPLSTAHREISRLDGAGIVNSTRTGNVRGVAPNPSSPLHEEVRGLVRKIFGPETLLRHALAHVDGIEESYIFGSWARRADGEPGPPARDVDLLVIGEPELKQVFEACREVESQISLEVNPVVLSREEWQKPRLEAVRAIRRGVLIPLHGTSQQ